MNFDQELKALITLAYHEDGEKDVTSQAVCDPTLEKEAVIIAREDGVICGLKFAEQIVHAVDEDILVDPFLEEGEPVKERMMVMSLEGKARSLLRIERVLLNFLSRLSGIASATHQFVQEVEGTGAVILDTRKTVPGWRFLDKYAVAAGGGINHRMGLEDIAMVKDTHVACCESVGAAVEAFQAAETEKPLIVEVRDLAELGEVLEHSKAVTRVVLDNFDLDQMKEAVELASGRIVLEASGGITLENAREVAETGVHFLSIGALTHSVKGFDFSFQL